MTLLSVALGLGTALFVAAAVWQAYEKMKKGRGRILLFFIFFVLGVLRMSVEQRPVPELIGEVSVAGEAVEAEGKLADITVKEKRGKKQYTLLLKGSRLTGEQEVYVGRMLVYMGEEDLAAAEAEGLKPGRKVRIVGTVSSEEEPGNPGEFDFSLYYRAQKIRVRMFGSRLQTADRRYSPYQTLLLRIRTHASRILGEIAVLEDAGVFRAAVLGDRGSLDEEIRDLYQKNGIAHLLAISGLHVSIIGMGIYGILRKMGLRFGAAGSVAGCFLVSYGLMTGASPSVLRAVIMLLCTFLAGYLGRTYDLISAACVACILLLFDSPYLITQGGFQLSFGAVLAIGGLGEGLIHRVKPDRIWQKTVLISLSIQLVTYPIVLYHFFQYPVYGIGLNFIVIPLMAYVIYSGIAGILLGTVSLTAGTAAIGTGHYILSAYRMLCIWCSKLPGYTLVAGRPHVWQIGAYYGILGMFALIFIYRGNPEKRVRWRELFCVSGICFFVLFHIPVQGLEVTFLDVGQGDGIFLETAGSRILVDGGSTSDKELGKQSLEPFLKSKGVSDLDYVFVSHGDGDHISGICYLLESVEDIRIKNLILPCLGTEDKAYELLTSLAEKRGISVKWMEKGDAEEVGKLKITCIYPGPDDPAGDRNEQSLVLKADYGGFHMLLTGDMSEEGEARILMQMGNTGDSLEELSEVQVLKAAHHGSKTSTSQAFLEAVEPLWTVLSYGEGNRYGHPAPEVVKRLEEQESAIWETAKSGAVTLKTDGRNIRWHCMKKGAEERKP